MLVAGRSGEPAVQLRFLGDDCRLALVDLLHPATECHVVGGAVDRHGLKPCLRLVQLGLALGDVGLPRLELGHQCECVLRGHAVLGALVQQPFRLGPQALLPGLHGSLAVGERLGAIIERRVDPDAPVLELTGLLCKPFLGRLQ